MIGRPTKLDEVAARRLVEAVERGNNRATAARLAGIGPSTLREWMARGRLGQEPFAAFLARLKKADATAEAEAVKLVRDAARGGTWQAACWWLERRRPRQWGRRDALAEVERERRADFRSRTLEERRAFLDAAQSRMDTCRADLARDEERQQKQKKTA